MTAVRALCVFAAGAFAPTLHADIPSYTVDAVATYTTATTLRGASDAGHFVGDQLNLGVSRAFLATPDDGLLLLPLPAGYTSSIAYDVNDSGVVVGTVADNTFPADLGEPAIWTPDGSGGYTVQIPQQFTTAPGPLGQMSIDGGQAVAINNAGEVVGWSRYQGFQGGPTTLFSTGAPPVNLQLLGFNAQVRDINDGGVIVGGGLRMDLNTGTVTSIGLPDPIQPGNVGFTDVIAFAVNDADETVVAANLASVPTENYLTYMHNDDDGFIRLNPGQVPSRFVGFYDNNDAGDVSASGGVLFRAENQLVPGYDSLLEPGSSHWDPALGFIDNNRRVYTTAVNTNTGENALVLLIPSGQACPGDADGSGTVDVNDISYVIFRLGNAGTPGEVDGDADGNGVVDVNDVSFVVFRFGDCG